MPTIAQLVRKGRETQDRQDQDAGPQGRAAAPRRLHPRLHAHARRSRTPRCARSPVSGSPRGIEVTAYIPGDRPQPAGALDRARAWRPCEGPSGRALQDHPRRARRRPASRTASRPAAATARRGRADDAPQGSRTPPRADARPDLPVGRRHPARQQGARCAASARTAEHIVYDALDEIEQQDRRRSGRRAEACGRERPPAARGQEPPGRWRHLPGAGRGPAPPGDDARDPLDRRLLAASAGRRRWPSAWPASCWTPATASAPSIKRREDLQKMAESNKAFAHYRW